MKTNENTEIPVNLDDHVIYIREIEMDVVPLSIAKKAVAQSTSLSKVDEVFKKLEESLNNLQKTVDFKSE